MTKTTQTEPTVETKPEETVQVDFVTDMEGVTVRVDEVHGFTVETR